MTDCFFHPIIRAFPLAIIMIIINNNKREGGGGVDLISNTKGAGHPLDVQSFRPNPDQ